MTIKNTIQPLNSTVSLIVVLRYLTISVTVSTIIQHQTTCRDIMLASKTPKSIKEICRKPPSHWVGDGFKVTSVFANKAFSNELSPFLMFDYATPKHFEPIATNKDKRGVGSHPHRGFETVTLAFQGEVEHADNQGNRDVIGPGDVQWMTAGRGIVHEEFHSKEFSERGGVFEMCQLWVNLPAEEKMSEPRYQPIVEGSIPKVALLSAMEEENERIGGGCGDVSSESALEDGYARIIAGEFRGVEGPAKTFTPVNLWDVVLLNKKLKFDFDIVEGHTTMVFVRRGAVKVQGKILNTADVAIMSPEGSTLTLQAKEKETAILILSGEPINESIAARGPFVMNTQKELREAVKDYQLGQNGF